MAYHSNKTLMFLHASFFSFSSRLFLQRYGSSAWFLLLSTVTKWCLKFSLALAVHAKWLLMEDCRICIAAAQDHPCSTLDFYYAFAKLLWATICLWAAYSFFFWLRLACACQYSPEDSFTIAVWRCYSLSSNVRLQCIVLTYWTRLNPSNLRVNF